MITLYKMFDDLLKRYDLYGHIPYLKYSTLNLKYKIISLTKTVIKNNKSTITVHTVLKLFLYVTMSLKEAK